MIETKLSDNILIDILFTPKLQSDCLCLI